MQSQQKWGRLRGIKRHEGAGLLEAIPERFEQLAHGRKGIGVQQGSQPLPEQALAAELRPYRLEQRATQLLSLVHQECQHHQHGKHDRKMLLAMSVVVLKVIALVFQGIEGLVFDFPSGDRKSTRLNSSHLGTSYAVFCLKKKMSSSERLGSILFTPADFVTIALLVALEGLISAENDMVLAVLVLGLPKEETREAI